MFTDGGLSAKLFTATAFLGLETFMVPVLYHPWLSHGLPEMESHVIDSIETYQFTKPFYAQQPSRSALLTKGLTKQICFQPSLKRRLEH